MELLFESDLHTGKPTHFDAVFQNTVQYLRDRRIPHVFTGTLALNTYIRPRFTNEIQLVCDCTAIESLADELAQLAMQQVGFSGTFRLWSPEQPAMAHALASRTPKTLFGVSADCPTALSLCWSLLEINDLRGETDVGSLLVAGVVRGDELQCLLEQNADERTLTRLTAVNASIQRGSFSGTYSDSVRARLLRHAQKGLPAN